MPRKPIVIKRSYITKHLLDLIDTIEHTATGDAVAPTEGGWDGPSDREDTSYTPYYVLTPATAGDANGSIGQSHSEIQLPYVLTGYGLSRSHVEDYMEMAAEVLVAMDRTIVVCGDSSWKIQQVRRSSIGGISRSDQTEPSEFSETDVYVLSVSKEL